MEHQNVASKVVRQQGFLRSHDQSDVAAALSEILLNVVSDSDVANSLRTIRDQVWLPDSSDRITPKPIADHKRKKQLFDEALNGLDSNQKSYYLNPMLAWGNCTSYTLAMITVIVNLINLKKQF